MFMVYVRTCLFMFKMGTIMLMLYMRTHMFKFKMGTCMLMLYMRTHVYVQNGDMNRKEKPVFEADGDADSDSLCPFS